MIELVYRNADQVTAWVAVRSPDPLVREHGFGPCSAIGVKEGERLIAGVVYHEYRGHSIQLSMASERPTWCNRRTLKVLLGYPFKQLHVSRITACTADNNKKLGSLVERLGFKLEGCIRGGFDGTRDMLVYGMLMSEAERWITTAGRQTDHDGTHARAT